jgi:phytoene dehydrogenase-like protein
MKLPSVYINHEPLLAYISSGLRKHLNPEENYMITLKDLIGRFGKGANRLINFLSGAGITCPGEKASAGEFLDFLQKVVISGGRIGYPKGGTKQIITKLSRKLESSGRIMRRAKVDEIVVKGNTARGVRVGKRIIRSKAVVCAFPLQFLFGIIDEELFHPEFRKVKNLEPSAGISIDFGLRKKVSDIDGVILTFDPLTMGMFTSNIDPGVAPKNKQLGTWFYQLPDVRGKREKEIKNLKALLAEIFPGIWKNVEWERVMKLPMVDGAILKPGQTRYERPDFCSTVKGLFFAGDTTRGEGCGGDIAFDSAIKCSEKILGFLSSSFPPLH